jgi:hypothetical protein
MRLHQEFAPNGTASGLQKTSTAESSQTQPQKSARALGVQTYVLNAGTANEIDTAFATVSEQKLAAPGRRQKGKAPMCNRESSYSTTH